MLAFTICILLPAGLFFAYVLVNFGADFRREAHMLGRRGVRKMPLQASIAVNGPARPSRRPRSVANVIVMRTAKRPSKRGVA